MVDANLNNEKKKEETYNSITYTFKYCSFINLVITIVLVFYELGNNKSGNSVRRNKWRI